MPSLATLLPAAGDGVASETAAAVSSPVLPAP